MVREKAEECLTEQREESSARRGTSAISSLLSPSLSLTVTRYNIHAHFLLPTSRLPLLPHLMISLLLFPFHLSKQFDVKENHDEFNNNNLFHVKHDALVRGVRVAAAILFHPFIFLSLIIALSRSAFSLTSLPHRSFILGCWEKEKQSKAHRIKMFAGNASYFRNLLCSRSSHCHDQTE